jgi:uncharacterized membrane protein
MILLIAIVIGAIVGGATSGGGGALAGALFGWLVLRSLRQQREIEALRGQSVARAVAEMTPLQDRVEAAPAAAAVAVPTALPPTPAIEPAASAAEPIAFVAEPAAVAQASATSAGDALVAAPRRDLLAPLKRWLFGGNTIVKAGIGILFVGLAFLAKYASEHAHLPVEVRLAAVGAAAVILLGVGWRLRLKRPDYAQVLQGGAVAVMYLTLFAAFRYYGVLAALPAFVLMVAVAALAAALAVLQDARALAVIGALGGFATPLIVSTGSSNHVALFTYYLVLDIGIALVAWSKTWRLLNVVGFVATFVVATAWGVLTYRPEDFASSQAFRSRSSCSSSSSWCCPRAASAPQRRARAAAQRDAMPGSTAAFCSACRRSPSRSNTAWSAARRSAPRWRRSSSAPSMSVSRCG